MLHSNTAIIASLFDTSCTPVEFSGVSIDSRDCNHKLFIAIKGERFDGHDFIADAMHNGAVAVVAHKEHVENIPTIYVADTIGALGTIAQFHKRSLEITTIGITGSNGKTTTKNMLYQIFSQVGHTFKTPGNLNNHIGVPLSLLQLDRTHDYAIIEMGANHLGEIAYLRSLVEPDVACVINTLDAHIGEFGGKENLITAKGEIYTAQSINVVNTATRYEGQYYFGKGGDLDYEYLNDVELQVLGAHNTENALAAAAIATVLGIPKDIIKKGLANTPGEPGRLERITTHHHQIINDSYNASPSSTRYALEVLAAQPGMKIAVLGVIAELGEDTNDILHAIGEYANSLEIDYLYAVGEGAEAYGLSHMLDISELATMLRQHSSATILLKGSRVAKLERIIPLLST